MGKGFFPHELEDKELQWILHQFIESNPNYLPIEIPDCPLFLIPLREVKVEKKLDNEEIPARPLEASDNLKLEESKEN